MERSDDDQQATRKKPSMRGPEPSSRCVVRGVGPAFRSMTPMIDAVFHRSVPSMPPTGVSLGFVSQTDETETTTTHREEKKKSFPMSKEYVREGSQQFIQKPFQQPEKTQSSKTFWDETRKPPNPNWLKASPNKLPKHFPLELTNVNIKLEECSFHDLLTRLTDSFRVMSIQAKFFGRSASAALLTTENVELYLTLWESDNGKDVIVEVMRRRGDTLIFHQYAHHILDAASGKFDPSVFSNDEGSLLYLRSAEKKLKTELSRVVAEKDMAKESVVALEIVFDLLKKDRRDARRLGMEGVCILANARKTVLSAAILTSRALLLGDQSITSPGLHEMIIGIIQKRSIGENEELMVEYPVDDDDDENFFMDDDDALQNYSPEYKEEMSLLFNLALDALAHALEVATTFGLDISGSPTGSTFVPHQGSLVVDTFLARARKLTELDMLTTLLQTVQRAHAKPHNAWLAAKCLRYICAASPDAAQRTCNLCERQFLGEAYVVGVASHAKLEYECRLLEGFLPC